MPDEHLPTITHVSPGQEWLDSRIEETIDPEQPIIDPHHHFSEHWGGYFSAELLKDLDAGHQVRGTVYVQCGLGYRESGPERLKPLGETETVLSIIERIPAAQRRRHVAAAIVGYADLSLGAEVDEVLEGHLAIAGDRFRGIRCSGAHDPAFRHGVLARPKKNLYRDEAFRQGFARLKKYGLSFDAWLYHPQLDDLLQLAREFPDVPIMLDHIGCPLGVGPYAGKASEVMREWAPSMKRLASCQNVHVKLGGLGTAVFGYRYFEHAVAPSSQVLAEAWTPYFQTCIEIFGARRCMFESNFPVDRSVGSYHVLWNAFKRIAAGASEPEKMALFHNNALRFYRLPMPLAGQAA